MTEWKPALDVDEISVFLTTFADLVAEAIDGDEKALEALNAMYLLTQQTPAEASP